MPRTSASDAEGPTASSSLSRPDGGSCCSGKPLSRRGHWPRGGRGAIAAGPARLTGHLLDQPLHPPRLEEAGRQQALRISAVLDAVQRRQASDLVLFVLRLVDAAPLPGRPRPQPAAIDLDDHGRRGLTRPGASIRRRRRWSARALPQRQVGADLVGQLPRVAGRDRQAGQPHGKGGIGKRVEPGRRR